MAGDCCRLTEEASAQIRPNNLSDRELRAAAPWAERRRLWHQLWKARFYRLMGHPTKPKVIGNNVGIWRSDFEVLNGYDEHYVGWGCEDDDLRLRIRKHGLAVRSILNATYTYHLWHPPVATFPQHWHAGHNVAYYAEIATRPARCREGLHPAEAETGGEGPQTALGRAPFAEVAFHPGLGRFSGRASWNVLVVADRDVLPLGGCSRAHLVVSRDEAGTIMPRLQKLGQHVPATRRGKLLKRAA
jgi:hypothetical protein